MQSRGRRQPVKGDWRAFNRAPIALDRLPPPATKSIQAIKAASDRGLAAFHVLPHSKFKSVFHRAWPNPADQILDFDPSQPYTRCMTKLLDEAFEAVRRLPSRDQDDIARAIMQLAGSELATPVSLSAEERQAIARSKAAARSGEFATDEQVLTVWAKHGL